MTLRSPPVRAPAMMKVPASMRSGMMRCLAPCSLADALDANRRSAGALDFGAHGVEQRSEVGDFGFAGAVLHDGFAVGERGGHEQVFGSGDGDFVEDNFGAAEAVGGGFDVAVLLRDLGAQALETFDVQVDGARTDGAAAGKRNAGAAATGDQRPEHEGRGAHGLDQFVGGFRSSERPGADGGAMMGASVAEFDFGSHGGEQFARSFDVAHLRNVLEDDLLIGKQSRSHAGKSGVFRAADANGAEKWIATADD